MPTHETCEEACCEKPVSCCESEDTTKCEMTLTSCNISLFIPLVSAPLIKVESNIQLDITLFSPVSDALIESQQSIDLKDFTAFDDHFPLGFFPLLI